MRGSWLWAGAWWTLASFGCSPKEESGYWDELSCEHDVTSWYDDALYNAVRADEGGGDFDLDPPGDPSVRREGYYRFDTGDFAWTTTYAEGSALLSTTTEGYGTISSDGDLDLLSIRTAHDRLDLSEATRERQQRTGCLGELVLTDVEVGAALDQAPADDASSSTWSVAIESADLVRWTLTDSTSPGELSAETVERSDGTSTFTYAFSDDEIESYTLTEESAPSGRSTAQFEQVPVAADVYYVGSYESAVDGSSHWIYDVIELGSELVVASWDYDESYGGLDGSVPTTRDGTLGFLGSDDQWYDCEYHEDASSCTYTCDFGSGPEAVDCT